MLGSRIASLRRNLGLSQQELAKQLNISTSALGMYEQGRRNPSQNILVALSQKFDVSTDYLLTGHICTVKDCAIFSELIRDTNIQSVCPGVFSSEELAIMIAVRLTGK